MPKPTKGPRLGSGPSHERLILRTLAEQLFEHGKITTTEAKAKRLRPLAEKLITFAKKGDLQARREVMARIANKSVVHTLFTTIAPTFATREGGYTRITKVGPRKGDNAPMAVIELVTDKYFIRFLNVNSYGATHSLSREWVSSFTDRYCIRRHRILWLGNST